MRRAPPLPAAAAAVAATSALTIDAHALGPVGVEVGGRVGYGTTPSNFPSGSINPLGLGLGARAGIDVSAFYGGVNFMYYLGGSEDGFSELLEQARRAAAAWR